jgi:nickel/cobalt transporter (NicO) family protein
MIERIGLKGAWRVPDWILAFLSGLQRAAVTGLASELRAGGVFTVVLAFALGALHALTPGHGKAALAAYFMGQEAKIATGIRVALAAALLHVIMGFVAFAVLRFIVNQTPLITARGSPFFTVTGYGLILFAGLLMIFQSVRPASAHAGPHALTAGIGLLPCPLTITVLGFAWAQAIGPMVAVVLIALAAGIAFTIGIVALLAIVGRRLLGRTLADRLPGFERRARALQGAAGLVIVILAAYAIIASLIARPIFAHVFSLA